MRRRTAPGGSASAVAAVGAVIACAGGCGAARGAPRVSSAPSDPDRLARAAVVLASCEGDRAAHFLDLMRTSQRAGTDSIAVRSSGCLASDGHACASIERCSGLRTERVDRRSCSGSRTCNGDVSTSCVRDQRTYVDCRLTGLRCVEGDCVEPGEGMECNPSTFAPSCVDGRPVNCVEGRVRRAPRCSDAGLVCAEAAPRWVTSNERITVCRGPGADCPGGLDALGYTIDDGTSCDESGRVVACVNGGAQLLDCSSLSPGLRCGARPGRLQPGGMRSVKYVCGAGECDELDNARCEGDVYVFCAAGQWQRVSCSELGFSGCSPGGPGKCVDR